MLSEGVSALLALCVDHQLFQVENCTQIADFGEANFEMISSNLFYDDIGMIAVTISLKLDS